MTLTVRLDKEEETRLQQIVEALNAGNQSAVIRQIIYEKWLSLQTERTFLERRGEHPVHVLAGPADASLRANRKKELETYLTQKAAARRSSRNAKNVD